MFSNYKLYFIDILDINIYYTLHFDGVTFNEVAPSLI